MSLRHQFRWCFIVLKKRVKLFPYRWVYTIKTNKFIASKSWCTFVGVRVKHIVEKSCVLKKSTFSVMYVFGQTATEIIHYYIWCFYSVRVQRGCWVFPPFCSWNYMGPIAMAMLGAKPQEKIWYVFFTDLRKFLKAQISESVVEMDILLTIPINTKPSNLTDLASMFCEVVSLAKLGRVICFGFYNHFILGYIRFMYSEN